MEVFLPIYRQTGGKLRILPTYLRSGGELVRTSLPLGDLAADWL